jgi:hypothetical protein
MIFDTPESIAFAQLAARKGALSLELKGLKRNGRSAYSICKSEYGLKGSRESVLRQMQALVDNAIAAKRDAMTRVCTCLPGQAPHEPGCQLWVAEF